MSNQDRRDYKEYYPPAANNPYPNPPFQYPSNQSQSQPQSQQNYQNSNMNSNSNSNMNSMSHSRYKQPRYEDKYYEKYDKYDDPRDMHKYQDNQPSHQTTPQYRDTNSRDRDINRDSRERDRDIRYDDEYSYDSLSRDRDSRDRYYDDSRDSRDRERDSRDRDSRDDGRYDRYPRYTIPAANFQRHFPNNSSMMSVNSTSATERNGGVAGVSRDRERQECKIPEITRTHDGDYTPLDRPGSTDLHDCMIQ